MSWIHEIESLVATSRLFKAAHLWHNLGPKVLPELLVSVALLSGDVDMGNIRQLNFVPANPCVYVKEKLDFVDNEKLEATQSLVEGGYLGEKLEIVATAKVIPGVEIGEETIVKARARAGLAERFNAAEAYLLAIPTAYV